jgi:hypothetical protein
MSKPYKDSLQVSQIATIPALVYAWIGERDRALATRNCREDAGWSIIRRSPLQSVLGFFAR